MDIEKRYKEAKFIKNKLERLEKHLRDTTRQNSNTSDLIDTLIRTEYIKHQIEEGKAKFNYYIAELLNEMDKLDNTEEYDIIFKKYILFKTWEEIEQECHYRMSLVLGIHDRAIKKLHYSK